MANAPATWELFVLEEGQSKVTMTKDTKLLNAATFRFLKEDHTLANMIRTQLLKNPKVLFAGYKVPHPLEYEFVLKIQTTSDTTPLEVLQQEINSLIAEVSGLEKTFANEFTRFRLEQGGARR